MLRVNFVLTDMRIGIVEADVVDQGGTGQRYIHKSIDH